MSSFFHTHSHPGSLRRSFLMNMLLTVSSLLFPLITFPYVSRILLPAGYGRISFAASVISYFTMLAQLGIPVYGIRACAGVRDNPALLCRTVRDIFWLNLAATATAYLAFFTALLATPRLHQEKPLLLLLSLNIFLGTLGMEWLYKALEQYTYITLRSLLFKLLALIATFLLIHSPDDVLLYGGISIFAASASNLLNFLNLPRLLPLPPPGGFSPVRSLPRIKEHLKSALVFFAMSCATTVYTNLDTVMLGFLSSETQVGYYTAAVKIKTILVGIITSLGAVLLPRASYYTQNGLRPSLHRLLGKAFHLILLLALPLTSYFLLFAPEGIIFLSGPAYIPAVTPMRILMPTLLLIGLTNLMGMQMLVPSGKEKSVLYSVTAGALVNLVLNLLLIPRFACTGAAIGTLAAESAVLLIQTHILQNSLTPILRRGSFRPLLLGTLAATFVCAPVKLLHLPAFFALALSALLFFLTYLAALFLLQDPLAQEIRRRRLPGKNKD